MFPCITGCIGYRRTYQLSGVVFAAALVLLPLSNRITGPVPGEPSGSGGGAWQSGSGALNNTDFCGNDVSSDKLSVNVDSVTRIYHSISGWCCSSSLHSCCQPGAYSIRCEGCVIITHSDCAYVFCRGTTLAYAIVHSGNSVLVSLHDDCIIIPL